MPAFLSRFGTPLGRVWGRLRAGLARTPLRLRLVAALVIVVIVALGGAGAATAATLQTYLTGRVDAQLSSVEPQIEEHQISAVTGAGDLPGRGRGGGGGDGGRGLPSAYVIAVNDASGQFALKPTSYLVDPGQPLPHFPDFTGSETKREGTRYLTTFAERGDETWRLLATPVTLADGSTGTLMIAQSLDDVQNTVNRLTILLAVIGAGAVIVLAGVGYLIVRASLRPLRAVERTAAYVAAGDLSHRVPSAHDRTEVGQLSVALNTMLGQIETAFAARAESEEAARRSEETARQSEDRMRRFVADASHELRTPLTSIRGFAELYRQGAAPTPPDIARIMTRIESEAQRMGVLVEDLLLLAHLDRERPLARTPVDLLALATDAVHDAQATAPDRHITLTVDPAGGPPVVLGDELRLRQVVANLMTNALRHTPAGTAVRVRVASQPPRDHSVVGTAVFEVADDGPGLAAEQAARVFERFYRADAARGSAGGTGLGLAIVSALVAGHAGTVEVDSEPGHGARFRVTLALAPVDSHAV